MSFYNFKNIPVVINGNNLISSEIGLEQQIELMHPIKNDERVSEQNLPNSPYQSNLRLKYYLTGVDFIKNLLSCNEEQSITGNIAGLLFQQGYVSDYSISCIANEPVEVTCNISIYDKISGSFSPTNPINKTGLILRFSDATINNLNNYTTYPLTNILQANFTYNCNLQPSYSYDTSGIPPLRAEKISIHERTIACEIISDSTNLDVPLSGDSFALTITCQNPNNNSINETFSCSGKANYKSFNIVNGRVHSHSLKIQQNHLNNIGKISGIIVNTNTFDIYSNDNTHPFIYPNNIDRIVVADTLCTGFIITKQSTNDKITVPISKNIINGPLTIYSTKGNFIWPNSVLFNYPNIIITGLSQNTGYAGTAIYISGTNFNRVSQVNFGGISSTFQIIDSQTILTIVPNNAITNKIQLVSDLRLKTGYSNDTFYCQPSITLLTPVTGIWKDTLTIGGSNFSGTTGIKFNGVDAFNFKILSNVLISGQTPATGNNYSEGYVSILTSGGFTKSISQYRPQVPLYNFSPTSGIYFTPIGLSLIVDSGYLFPSGTGYKVRVGGIDTIFYQSGTGLSGQIPFGGQSDYIYIYKPDGTSTYTVNPNIISIQSRPSILSITPSVVNQYSYFNPVLIGQNFEFFTNNIPYFFAISGGINKDIQQITNIISNSGGNADTMYINNFIVTGSTGYYDILVQNFAGTGIFKSGLFVKSGINQANSCIATVTPSTNQLYQHIGSLAIDNSTGTFVAMNCNQGLSGTIISITPKNNGVLNINLIKILMDNVPSLLVDTNSSLPQYTSNTSGELSLWYKNSNKPFYNSEQVNLQGATFNLFNSGITGVRIIKIATPRITAIRNYLGISEIQIF